MAHITSIGAGMFSDLAVHNHTTSLTGLDTQAEFDALFVTETDTPAVGTFSRIKNVREFPAMGTPPNIVNVPTYGQKTSQQIQGQADAPTMEITINYIPSAWASGTVLGSMVGDGKQKAFRFALLNSEPAAYGSAVAGLGTAKGGTAGTPANENTYYYWVGKIEALLVNPQLTDANTATLTISLQSSFFGAYTAA
jgi:hypothetical protein